MDTNKSYTGTKDRDMNSKAQKPSINRPANRLAHRFWWGWSTELNGSFKA